MDAWIKGMDLSSLLEIEEMGGRFCARDMEGDAIEIAKSYGMNMMRLRLWHDPYSPEGEPYGGGTCDLPRVMTLARRGKRLGIPWMLNLHYSDFWADPGKQTLPKAWQGLDEEGLVRAVYCYTRTVLARLKEAELLPAIVCVGNELSNGLLWPLGKYPHFKAMARFIDAGIRGARDVAPDIPILLHLDNGGKNSLYREWFDNYFAAGGTDFQYIGLSFYPFWHGSMESLRKNMEDVALRYRKELLVVEASAGWTLEDYAQYERLPPEKRRGMAATPELAAKIEYPMTPEGQCAYLRDLAQVIRDVPEGLGKGFIYWEPIGIPVPGYHWATEVALPYIGEKGPCGNEWANQALFDYEGRALPALEAFKEL